MMAMPRQFTDAGFFIGSLISGWSGTWSKAPANIAATFIGILRQELCKAKGRAEFLCQPPEAPD
jgi:hypothetical protein